MIEMNDMKPDHEPCGCDAQYGDPHIGNCEQEECPFCHQQLIGCDCVYKLLGIDQSNTIELTKTQMKRWDQRLRAKGLVLYGKEVRYKASNTWTSKERDRVIALICETAELTMKNGVKISCRQVTGWIKRIQLLRSADPVFLEMNRNHFITGAPLTWKPPS